MPRRALTAASIDRIKPPVSGQVEHFDKGFPGLALRISYGGGKSFVYFYRIGGETPAHDARNVPSHIPRSGSGSLA